MKRFAISLVVVLAAAILTAALAQGLRHGSGPDDPADTARAAGYILNVADTPELFSIPTLPDISDDTVDSVRAAMPAPQEGVARARSISDLYIGLARDLHIYAKMQQRFDPLAIVVESGVYTPDMLVAAVNDPALIAREDNGDYKLFVPILIERGAALVISDGTCFYMSAEAGALIIAFGRLDVVGAQVTGWHFTRNAPAHYTTDRAFRPYLAALCGSTMNVAGSTLKHLGYFDAKAYGLSYSSCDNVTYEDKSTSRVGGTGRVIGNRLDDLYYGFYTYESRGVRVVRNQFDNSVVYGIDPHDRSFGLIVAHNTVRGTRQKHGIIFSRDVQDSYVFGNICEGNARAGIMMDRNSSRNVIAQNILRGNGGDGMAFYESGDNLSYGNIMAHNAGSGLRIRNSRDIRSHADVISHNGAGGVQAYAIDLLAVGAVRNVKKDPYEQAVSASIVDAEMVGNTKADITLRDVDTFMLSGLKRFDSPRRLMAGDVALSEIDGNSVVLTRAD